MGNAFECQKKESEEEIIERIFKNIPIHNIQTKTLYTQYDKFLILNNNPNEKENQNSISLNYFEYSYYIIPIIDIQKNIYRLIHLDYFDSLRRMENKESIIGTILIFLSNGNKEEKVSCLCELYNKCFNYNICNKKIFVNYIEDVINANTNVCLESFNHSISSEGNVKLNEIYNNSRKKKLNEMITNNYDFVINKYNDYQTPNDNKIKNKKENEMICKEIFELIYGYLDGVYIRNWLAEEYIKDNPILDSPCCN